MTIVWEDPPVVSAERGIWRSRLAPCVDQPKRWALIGAFNSSTIGNLQARGNSGLALSPGVWEFRSRKVNSAGEQAPDNHRWLYARYMGEETS